MKISKQIILYLTLATFLSSCSVSFGSKTSSIESVTKETSSEAQSSQIVSSSEQIISSNETISSSENLSSEELNESISSEEPQPSQIESDKEQIISSEESSEEIIESSESISEKSEETISSEEPIESSEEIIKSSDDIFESSEEQEESSEEIAQSEESSDLPISSSEEELLSSEEIIDSSGLEDSSSSEEPIISSKESSEELSSSEEIVFSSSETIESSSNEPISSEQTKRNKETFKFYSVNDFHGAVNYEVNSKGYTEYGLANYFGFLKQQKEEDPDHTIILSAGDMWQGSYESNYNYGDLVNQAMNITGFDAMALGNHEFDWGQDVIVNNALKANFPFLSANVKQYKNGYLSENNDWEHSDVIGASTMIERAGYKIGIVGALGESQITSITSSRVENIGFVNEEKMCIAESEKLKEAGADLVILLLHNDASYVIGTNGTWSTSSTLNQYFDGVFCAHTHTKNREKTNEVPLLQAYSNGEAYSYLEITIEEDEKTLDYYDVIPGTTQIDEDCYDKINDFMTDYLDNDNVTELLNSSPGYLTDGNLDSSEVGLLGAAAIYDYCKPLYPEVCIGMMNSQRAGLKQGKLTFSDIFKAMPFFNTVVIVTLTGANIKKEASYSSTATFYGDVSSLQDKSYYTIAVIDYLIYHKNVKRNYDYFTDMNYGRATIIDEIEYPYPANMTFSYINKKGSISANDYRSTSPGFSL